MEASAEPALTGSGPNRALTGSGRTGTGRAPDVTEGHGPVTFGGAVVGDFPATAPGRVRNRAARRVRHTLSEGEKHHTFGGLSGAEFLVTPRPAAAGTADWPR